jgi:ankyrin repeat protein
VYGQVLKILLNAGAQVDSTDNNGQTALMLAAKNVRTLSVFEVLIQARANVLLTDNNGETALSLAIKYTDPDCSRIIAVLENEVNRLTLDGQLK